MPWKKETFEKEREFLLKVLSEAKAKLGWEVLSYQHVQLSTNSIL